MVIASRTPGPLGALLQVQFTRKTRALYMPKNGLAISMPKIDVS